MIKLDETTINNIISAAYNARSDLYAVMHANLHKALEQIELDHECECDAACCASSDGDEGERHAEAMRETFDY